MINEKDSNFNLDIENSEPLVDWENSPKLDDLKKDYQEAQSAHNDHIIEVDEWLSNLNGDQQIKAKKGRSKIVPKLIRKQAEWRYAALSEPFLSTDDLFNTAPATFEDKEAAIQNGQVLNYQINCKIDKTKFIDEYIRTAVDEGTVIVKTGWEYEEEIEEIEVPDFEFQPSPEAGQVHQQLHAMMQENPEAYQQEVPPEMQQAHELTMQQGTPVMPVQVGSHTEEQVKVSKNQPELEICDYNNVVIDPTCQGDLDKAEFIIYSFETSMSQLKKDGRYDNLKYVSIDNSSPLNEPDFESGNDSSFKFRDDARKKIIVHEYWGFWDYNDTGEAEPFVAAWVGGTLIRMDENPFPDKKLPFVSVQYLPRRKSVYGEPDGALLEDNQKIVGAVTRGMIDIIGRSANGQMGTRKDALDVTNARKFEQGADYKFNSNVDPRQAFHMETYPEIPGSALNMLNLQNNEAESLTGVKAFSQGISGSALGTTATGIRSALDATSKRELGILRRLANGINQIGRKIISMNAEFLSDQEIIRVTNEEFIAINREDLGGMYDIKLNISTAEADNEKAQELSFMLQTMGNNMDASLSQIILSDIARLRKMPELAKQIKEYQPQPNPMAEQMQQLEMQLLQAKIRNEDAKGRENDIDVEYKKAKIVTEEAKARGMGSKADLDDLDFVNKESGVNDANKEEQMKLSHAQEMEKKAFDRSQGLENRALDGVNAYNTPQ
jgi:hypothetical protein